MLEAVFLAEMSGAELEEISFRNLVFFYQDELMKIHRGEANAREFFSQNQSGRMAAHGVYRIALERQDRGHVLTPKTLKVLASIQKEP